MSQIARQTFKKIGKSDLGVIYRPYIIVQIFMENIGKWQPVEMVVDSGADYTLLPRRFSQILEIDLGRDCSADTTAGIGGSETIYLYKKGVKIRLGDWIKKAPVGILERDDIPPLLGRLEFLETLRVVFERRTTIFEL
jgi:predicted aspartyl protease